MSMSSYAKPNHRQPVDFIKGEHLKLVEGLRRWELYLVNKRNTTVGHRGGGSGMDPYITDRLIPLLLPELDKTLLRLWEFLRDYYKYPEGWTKVLIYNKHEEIGLDLYEKSFHDGFWERDPTF